MGHQGSTVGPNKPNRRTDDALTIEWAKPDHGTNLVRFAFDASGRQLWRLRRI
jgi:hypothetical protein